ncbi:MAG: hypothetical protein NWE89_11270 [Candidatus Bathyarchaeota archaeon]|nr:hypothetical protein [Candidatus Bathyarchaeota archaeon]
MSSASASRMAPCCLLALVASVTVSCQRTVYRVSSIWENRNKRLERYKMSSYWSSHLCLDVLNKNMVPRRTWSGVTTVLSSGLFRRVP